ncbi:uncharacterized protein LOC123439774 [Hordeum vulgare subsp. vulgare]|uniref:uncharacterized protein LOC123439774 n=1 Tax=Hordeum vulgare subsp. vulgare TaxID=112509 RepID=UPI001D1A524A|nr:uncharacterized protein LOC123439774 [Hordeum vulgare subsp. vulgare]
MTPVPSPSPSRARASPVSGCHPPATTGPSAAPSFYDLLQPCAGRAPPLRRLLLSYRNRHGTVTSDAPTEAPPATFTAPPCSSTSSSTAPPSLAAPFPRNAGYFSDQE